MINLSMFSKFGPIILAVIGLPAALNARMQLNLEKMKKKEKEFIEIRKYLQSNRNYLVDNIFNYYVSKYKKSKIINCVPLLTKEEWLPDQPIPLNDVEIKLDEIENIISETIFNQVRKIMPYEKSGKRFYFYSDAIRELNPPKLFEDNTSYRLEEIKHSKGIPELKFTISNYFKHINIGEALAFETAKYKAKIDKMKIRKALGNPFNLKNRYLLPGINTLTICKDGSSCFFYMLERDSNKVATGMGSYSVVPAGEFQPSCKTCCNKKDFDIWKNIMREYNEEILNAVEDNNYQTDYSEEPYVSFNKALDAGQVQCFYLGFGLDPLSLKGEILTVCIWDWKVFKSIFKNIDTNSSEGKICVAKRNFRGFEFNEDNVNFFLRGNTMPVGKACLKRTLEFKSELGL